MSHALRHRYGRAKSPGLKWEKDGVRERHPAYLATGIDYVDGSPARYSLYFESGLWRAAGSGNIFRAGGVSEHTVAAAKRRVAKIDEAARKAYAGGYSLSPDVVMLW